MIAAVINLDKTDFLLYFAAKYKNSYEKMIDAISNFERVSEEEVFKIKLRLRFDYLKITDTDVNKMIEISETIGTSKWIIVFKVDGKWTDRWEDWYLKGEEC